MEKRELKLSIHPCWVGDEALMGEFLKARLDSWWGDDCWHLDKIEWNREGTLSVHYHTQEAITVAKLLEVTR